MGLGLRDVSCYPFDDGDDEDHCRFAKMLRWVVVLRFVDNRQVVVSPKMYCIWTKECHCVTEIVQICSNLTLRLQ